MRIFRLALFATILCSLCSCNNGDGDFSGGNRYPILFGSVDSRAVADIESLKTEGFEVYAYFVGNTGAAATFEKDVTYSPDQNVWGYEGIQYWIPGTNYWFRAFYPSNLEGLEVNNTNNAQSFTISDFDINKQVDVMVSNQESCSVGAQSDVPTWPENSNNTGSVVNLKFNHILACVVIKVKSEIDNITIRTIELGGADDFGDYNGETWSSENTTTITMTSGTSLTKGADFADVTKGGILVIPNGSTGKTLKIEASNKVYNINFPAGTWEKGNKYTYTVSIKQDDIIFVDAAPYVEEWESESATGSVIIK